MSKKLLNVFLCLTLMLNGFLFACIFVFRMRITLREEEEQWKSQSVDPRSQASSAALCSNPATSAASLCEWFHFSMCVWRTRVCVFVCVRVYSTTGLSAVSCCWELWTLACLIYRYWRPEESVLDKGLLRCSQNVPFKPKYPSTYPLTPGSVPI